MDVVGFPGCPLHDPLAVGYVIKPSIFEKKEISARVETEGENARGMLVLEERPGKYAKSNASFCTDVKSEEFLDYFIDTMTA